MKMQANILPYMEKEDDGGIPITAVPGGAFQCDAVAVLCLA